MCIFLLHLGVKILFIIPVVYFVILFFVHNPSISIFHNNPKDVLLHSNVNSLSANEFSILDVFHIRRQTDRLRASIGFTL